MEYPELINRVLSHILYHFYRFSGISRQKVLIKSIKTQVSFNGEDLPQREFYALNKKGKTMGLSKVLLGRFQEKPYHYCVVNGIAVRTLYRRRNIGFKLLKANVEFCKKEGFEFIVAYVESSNLASLNTFKKCGFYSLSQKEWSTWVTAEMSLMKGTDLLPCLFKLT
ncbi:GNAT family N-acetyltransferase [Carboxylicivirga sp. RSCT41]|uniref:GNAT family N-acetyltransferase n=1 Tax=Carboxylicivirga agarovorans TaxID=3417570 RepID=UPI003D34C823